MKPLRGSNRDASKAPQAKGGSKQLTADKKRKRQAKKLQLDPVDDDGLGKDVQLKKVQKRKAEVHPESPKTKGQENWKPISASSVADFEKVLDLAILATFAQKRTNKKDVQEHLNTLKKRFLEHCSKLKVPAYKQKQECAAYRLQEETKKSETEKKTLGSLDENLRAVVTALEKNEQETNSLEHQCSVLRNCLQDQEEEAEQVFHRKEAVLYLPPLRPAKNDTTLEAKMRKAVPDSEAETMARKLGEILQNSESPQELLLLAHRHVDEMFNPHPVTITQY